MEGADQDAFPPNWPGLDAGGARTDAGERASRSALKRRALGPSLDRRQGLFGGEGSGLYLNRVPDPHERADAHAFQQPDLGAESFDVFEHTDGRRFEYDPGGEPEVALQPLVPVDDPVTVVQGDELAAAGEERSHFEILSLL